MERLRILVPVFNDWSSLRILLQRLDRAALTLPVALSVTVIDDGSTDTAPDLPGLATGLAVLRHLEIVHLAVNVGHQRAIAIGLCMAIEAHEDEALLIMDGDGEDPPEQIAEMLGRRTAGAEYCIVAQRRKRTEHWTFKASYAIYRAVFTLLTGKAINFGNFSLISREYARRLILIPDLWNNLPAAMLRSRLPLTHVPIDRGSRYTGKSQMNYVSLVSHGLSGISVYADAIFVRLLLFSVALVVLTVFTVASSLVLRVFYPAYATPGWATTLSMGMMILVAQAFFTTLSSILMLLNNRVQRLVIPRLQYGLYIASRVDLVGLATKPAAVPLSARIG